MPRPANLEVQRQRLQLRAAIQRDEDAIKKLQQRKRQNRLKLKELSPRRKRAAI